MAPRTPASRVSLHALALTVVFLAVGIPSGNAWAKKFTSTIREGTAFRDRVKNGQPDDGEKRTTTATAGSFSLANGKGRVYLRGGFDVQTGLPNTQLLTTPPGTKAIGSLTALWQALRDRKQPVAKVKKMLNLKGGVTAVNYVAKPIETVKPKIKGLIKRNAQHQTFVQFLKSLAQAKKTLRVAATAEAGTCPAGTSTEDDAIAALACALIGLEPGKKKDWSALDLTNPETVKSLFSSSLTELGITLPEDSKLTILANATADLMKKI
ncbi:MAG: hypothetical protein FIA97_17905, partial [Methylococcaceae bacterium]|nr:hypothetical protein [Methylococcaceae bacterium]